jgi:hypothetical protein
LGRFPHGSSAFLGVRHRNKRVDQLIMNRCEVWVEDGT